MDLLTPYDRDALRDRFRAARPFPFIHIDNFLEPSFAREVARSYPTFDEALEMGRAFDAVNERLKIQVSDASRFPEPVERLNRLLADSAFLDDLEYITGVPKLLSDEQLDGAGMHVSGSQGRLDVHVDFNYFPERALHRRLNILVYLNERWEKHWGGEIELWDPEVKHCHHSLSPSFNRCVVFATSEVSFHGVTPISCDPGVTRQSFAAYYYTHEAPEGWNGTGHTTIFKARPNEVIRGKVLMPAERLRGKMMDKAREAKQSVKRLLGQD